MLKDRMRPFAPLFYIVAFWDAFTTIYGTIGILGGPSVANLAFSILIAAIMLVLFLNTFNLMLDKDQSNPMHGLVNIMWFIAVVYDIYTSFVGNKAFLTPDGLTFSSFIVVLMATALVCGSTMLASWMLYEDTDSK